MTIDSPLSYKQKAKYLNHLPDLNFKKPKLESDAA